VHHVPSSQLDDDTAQTAGMRRFAAITGRAVGSEKLWMGETRVEPQTVSANHHHGASEFVFRDGEQEVRICTSPGDYVFIPPVSAAPRGESESKRAGGHRDRPQHARSDRRQSARALPAVGPTAAAVRYRQRVARTRKLFAALTRRGSYRVLRGDLAFAGLPGVVYTPEAGLNLPAVAFGHDWLTGVERYAGLLEHLASWGIVAAAPNTERGLAPSVLNLAYDLGSALDIAAGVRLGPGKISVHPGKLGLAGHGFGGSAAVFAAAGMPDKIQAVAAIFPSVTAPPAEQPAATLSVPGVVFSAPSEAKALRSNAVELSRAWDAAALRVVSKARPAGLAEGRRLPKVLGLPGPHRKTHKTVRALLTGYLLSTLGRDKTYRAFADPAAALPGTEVVEHNLTPVSVPEKIVALLKG